MLIDGEYIEPGTPLTAKQYRAESSAQERSARVLKRWNAQITKSMKIVEEHRLKCEKLDAIKKKKAKAIYDKKRGRKLWKANYKDKPREPKTIDKATKKAIKKSMFLKLMYANDPDPIAELEKMRSETTQL